MGIGFYKEKDTDTFALYSSYTDSFVYKNMSLKELIFYYMTSGSKLNDVKMEYQYRLRDLNLDDKKWSKSDLKSYSKAEHWNLKQYFIEGIPLYVMPIKISKNKFVIYNSFEDTITNVVMSKKEAISYLEDFYMNIFTKKYLKSFLGMCSQNGYENTIRNHTFCGDKKKELYDFIETLKLKESENDD